MRILSRKDIEEIAQRIVTAYYALPEVKGCMNKRVDPEVLATQVLGLNLDYEHLSLDGETLGLTTFGEMGVEVFDVEGQPFWYMLDGKTILVERDLKDDITKVGRCNFSIAHECSHQALKMLFPREYGVTPSKVPAVHFYKANSEIRKPIKDWEEWQANTLAAAVLMPQEAIDYGMYVFGLGEKISMLNRVYNRKIYDQFCCLADYLGTSKKALAIRLKSLGKLDRDYLDNPYDLVDIYGGI